MADQATQPAVETAADPVLKLNFLSHGTLESKNLEKTRAFYTEFLGLEVVRTSPVSLLIRLGGPNTIAVVEQKRRTEEMPLLNHNGLDVDDPGGGRRGAPDHRRRGGEVGPLPDLQAQAAARHIQPSSSGTWTTIAGRS